MDWETLALHTGVEIDEQTGASSVPIYQASTFHQARWDEPPAFDYARSGNPTRAALETIIATLEGALQGFAFASGMAAMAAVLMTLSTGDHIVATEDIYGGTFRALTRIVARLGITTTFVDASDLQQVAAAFRDNTRLLLLESPSNPTLGITDLAGAIALAKARGVRTAVDNTFMSPFLQRPHALGADFVVHSGTKFLGGHSDVVAGLVTVTHPDVAQEVYLVQNGLGGVLAPHDAWLLMRGIKTLPIRMQHGQASARILATYLASHPKVARVYYPGLETHPGYATHAQQADGPGAVLSFTLANATAVQRLSENLKLPIFAVSLGAAETILSYPVRMSHAAMPEAERLRRGITDGLLRLSVGIESVDDLRADFEQALAQV